MMKRRRIGILGGSFDPVHFGHLVLAEEARCRLCLEKVIFIPAHIPPHKRNRMLAPAKDRLFMAVLATRGNPFFEVSKAEFQRSGISYSVQTIKQLKSEFTQADFYFIVGSDFLKEFSTWKDIEELSKICHFVIALRPGYPLKNIPKQMRKIQVAALDISSTNIRRRIRERKTIRYLVPEEVRKYILRKRLYCYG